MKKLPLALGVGALTLGLVLTGCTAESPASQSTTPNNTAPSASAPSSSSNFADEMFVMMMIPHHEQAIEMSDIVLANDGLDPQIAELAEQIKNAQGPEIERMLGWLDDWGVQYDADTMAGMDHGAMDGMMSAEDLTALENADAAAAGGLFLGQMITRAQRSLSCRNCSPRDSPCCVRGAARRGGPTGAHGHCTIPTYSLFRRSTWCRPDWCRTFYHAPTSWSPHETNHCYRFRHGCRTSGDRMRCGGRAKPERRAAAD